MSGSVMLAIKALEFNLEGMIASIERSNFSLDASLGVKMSSCYIRSRRENHRILEIVSGKMFTLQTIDYPAFTG